MQNLRSLIFALIGSVALLGAAPCFATDFLKRVEDVPLPPGFAEAGEAVEFDTAEGRIVAVAIIGAAEPASVQAFYQKALTALGWSPAPGADGALYRRGREQLTIHPAPSQKSGQHEFRIRWLLAAPPSAAER